MKYTDNHNEEIKRILLKVRERQTIIYRLSLRNEEDHNRICMLLSDSDAYDNDLPFDINNEYPDY